MRSPGIFIVLGLAKVQQDIIICELTDLALVSGINIEILISGGKRAPCTSWLVKWRP